MGVDCGATPHSGMARDRHGNGLGEPGKTLECLNTDHGSRAEDSGRSETNDTNPVLGALQWGGRRTETATSTAHTG